MEGPSGMKRLCELYLRRAWLAGVVYCAVPTVAWFAVVFAIRDFREVYLLRLAIALVAGCAVAALANQFAVNLWVAKHRSPAGPATVFDGLLLGAASGWGTALVPPLTGLIASHGLEATKTLIIAGWLASAAVGAVLGAVLAAIGRKHLDRQAPAPTGGAQ